MNDAENSIRQRGAKRKQLPPSTHLNKLLSYNPETGELRWKERPSEYFKEPWQAPRWNRMFAGKECGSKAVRPSGAKRYMEAWIPHEDGTLMNVSITRIIFAMLGIEVPVGCEIDHVDRDPWNNRLSNLRVATPSQNMCNTAGYSKKKSGLPKCVFKDGVLLRVQIVKHRKLHIIGWFKTIDEAVIARDEAIHRLHGEFANNGVAPEHPAQPQD